MRKLGAVLSLVILIAGMPGIADHAQNGNTVSVALNEEQLHHEVSLVENQSHTLYETKEVPSTCYREELVGYRDECETIYRDECDTVYEDECRTEYRQECRDTWRDECRTEYRDDCRTVYKDRCQTEYRDECRTEYRNECRTEYRNECRTENRERCRNENVCERVPEEECRTRPDGQQVCRTVYKDRCRTEQRCETVPEQKCERIPEQRCENVPKQECRRVPEQRCERVPEQECSRIPEQRCQRVPDRECTSIPEQRCERVPRQRCERVPEQVCRQVPEYRTVPYSCTETVTVPVGEELDFVVKAEVKVNPSEVPEGIIPNEVLKLVLSHEDVTLRGEQLSSKLVLMVKRNQSVNLIKDDEGAQSPGEKLVSTTFDLKLLDANGVKNGIGGGIRDLAIKGWKMAFTLGKGVPQDFLGLKLTLVRKRTDGQLVKVFDGIVDHVAISQRDAGTRTEVTVDFTKLRVLENLMPAKNYIVTLDASLATAPGQDFGTVLNPEHAGSGSKISKQPVTSQ